MSGEKKQRYTVDWIDLRITDTKTNEEFHIGGACARLNALTEERDGLAHQLREREKACATMHPTLLETIRERDNLTARVEKLEALLERWSESGVLLPGEVWQLLCDTRDTLAKRDEASK